MIMNMAKKPTRSFLHLEIVADSCVIVVLKLMYLKI